MERSSFFNAILDADGIPDRSYLAEDYTRYFSMFIGNGIFPNPSNQMQVAAIGNNMQISIKAGYAWINGYAYNNTDDLTKSIAPADGVLNRIDRVVLRLDFLNREIKCYVKQGVYASTPVATVLVRDADMYEIGIADIKVNKGIISITQADITDLRLNKDLCGIVHGTVDQADTTAIFDQFQSWYSTTKTNYDTDIDKWTEDKKNAFDNWYVTNTQAFLNQFNDWYGNNITKWSDDFTIWFDSIKGQLDGDLATAIATKVIELENKINTLSGTSGEKEKLNIETFEVFKNDIEAEIVNGIFKSYEDPALSNTVKDTDIWFDLQNKLIKFRAAGGWVTFDYSYA